MRKQRAAAIIHALQLNRGLFVLRLMTAARRADRPLHLAKVKRNPAEAGSHDHRGHEKICETSMQHPSTLINVAPFATRLKDPARTLRNTA